MADGARSIADGATGIVGRGRSRGDGDGARATGARLVPDGVKLRADGATGLAL
ncbi:MAG: hypothetical protein H5U40_05255 [Polyangiaceae bacterium]|nr:hypothetical protein [Polyangiaceae bacterium]